MTTIWVLGETRDGSVRRVTYELLTAARGMAPEATVTVVLLGEGLDAAAADIAAHGADTVLVIDDPRLAHYSPDGWASVIAGQATEAHPDVILGSSSARGRDLTPRVAAVLGVSMVSDVVEAALVDGALQAVRPIYAGKALAHVRAVGTPKVLTLRPNSYPAADATGTSGAVSRVALTPSDGRAVVGEFELAASARPDVAEADIIVTGGRGMGGPDNFHLIEDLADALGAGVGASRAVVDAGWRPHSEQVGQTGKTVSPSLYVACGVSGAVQHLAGMKTAKYIVAVNKDPEAPIFAVADYGIVGDVFDVLPPLTEAVKQTRSG
jgi:electron transfer flavoprotein alpha subunit